MATCRISRTRTGVVCLNVVLALGSLVLSGCDDINGFALSLQPSYTPPDLEVDQGLVGSWITKEGDATLSFEQGEGKEYRIVEKETEGGRESSAQFEGHLVRLGASSFVDFFPSDTAGGNEFYWMHLLRAHSIARIELSQDTLEMAFLDGAWLQKKIDEKSVDVSYQKTNGTLLLTGTTEEVQNLLFLHGNDNEAFPDMITLTRQETKQ